jgi:hypothetical protein
MGTDVYLDWNGKTSEESDLQRTGFSIDAGNVGVSFQLNSDHS